MVLSNGLHLVKKSLLTSGLQLVSHSHRWNDSRSSSSTNQHP